MRRVSLCYTPVNFAGRAFQKQQALKQFCGSTAPELLTLGTLEPLPSYYSNRKGAPHAPGSVNILLLSLQTAASGLNLVQASHVIFLHPFNASTADAAIRFELQAIGRVRRLGQERKEVHVWRLVTQNTLEQEMTEQ